MLRFIKNKVTAKNLGLSDEAQVISMPSAIYEAFGASEETSESNFVQNESLTSWYQSHSAMNIYNSYGYTIYEIDLPTGLTVPCRVTSENGSMALDNDPTEYTENGTITLDGENLTKTHLYLDSSPVGKTFYLGLCINDHLTWDRNECEHSYETDCTYQYKNTSNTKVFFYPTTLADFEETLTTTVMRPCWLMNETECTFSTDNIGLVFKVTFTSETVGTIQEVYINANGSYSASSGSGSAHFSGSDFGSGWD